MGFPCALGISRNLISVLNGRKLYFERERYVEPHRSSRRKCDNCGGGSCSTKGRDARASCRAGRPGSLFASAETVKFKGCFRIARKRINTNTSIFLLAGFEWATFRFFSSWHPFPRATYRVYPIWTKIYQLHSSLLENLLTSYIKSLF